MMKCNDCEQEFKVTQETVDKGICPHCGEGILISDHWKGVIEFGKEYGESMNGNFFICDTIPVPHPYMIGAKHVAYASDHHGGILDEWAIQQAEANGIRCEVRGCNLSFEQHEKALLVACKDELAIDGKNNPELHEWLMAIKDKVETEKKYAGFSFIRYNDWYSNHTK